MVDFRARWDCRRAETIGARLARAAAHPARRGLAVPPGARALSFSAPANFPAGDDPHAVGVGDFNGDGRPDLAVANDASNDVSILLGQAEPTLSGTATAAVTIGAAISASAVLAGGDAPGGEIVLRAYGPDDPACTSTAAFEQAVTAGGNGEYGTGAFTPPAAGTYNWTVSYGGDAVNAPVEIPCGATGLISMVAKAPAEPQPAGEGEPVTSPAPPAACPPLAVSSTGYWPAKRKQGRQVPGVRVRISVSDPSRLRVAAKLRFRRGGRARSADLGTHSLVNSGRRNLRLALPGRLRRALPLGSRVRLALTISARSRCGLHSTSRRVIRTRVVKVLAGSRDRGRGVLR